MHRVDVSTNVFNVLFSFFVVPMGLKSGLKRADRGPEALILSTVFTIVTAQG